MRTFLVFLMLTSTVFCNYSVNFRNKCTAKVEVKDARGITYSTLGPNEQENVVFDKNLSFRNGNDPGPILYLSQKKGIGHYRVNYAYGFVTPVVVRPIGSNGPTIVCEKNQCQSVENGKVHQGRIGKLTAAEPHFEVTYCPK